MVSSEVGVQTKQETGSAPGDNQLNGTLLKGVRSGQGEDLGVKTDLKKPTIGEGVAVPLFEAPSVEMLASQFNDPDRAAAFLRHRKGGFTDFEVVGWPTIALMMNGHAEGRFVADFCGGTGAVTNKVLKNFSPRGVMVIDSAAAMLELGREEITDRKVFFSRQDVQDMRSIPDNTFGLGVVTYGLEYLSDPIRGLKEISRVLEPGARFIVLISHHDRNMAYWRSGGNSGVYPDGVYVAERPSGFRIDGQADGDMVMMKRWFKPSTWYRMFGYAGFELLNSEEPVPGGEVARYAPDLYQRYLLTGHRMWIVELQNKK